MIPDSAAAIPVARTAARLAGPEGQVVLAVLVAVPGRGLSPASALLGGAAVSATAASVAARAFPTMQAAGVAYAVEAVTYRDDRQRSRRESRAAKAVAECASRYQAVAAVGTGSGMALWPADGCPWTVVDPAAGSLDALGTVLTEDGRGASRRALRGFETRSCRRCATCWPSRGATSAWSPTMSGRWGSWSTSRACWPRPGRCPRRRRVRSRWEAG